MESRKSWLLAAALLALSGRASLAQDVRYYSENGVTYRESTQTVKRAIPHTEMQQRDVTFLRERYTSDLQDVVRTYQVPITEYQYQPQWVGRWNPFVQPYVTYRMVPKTRWETRSETVKIPVSRREVVPEKLTQSVPVTTHKIAEERVTTRVAVGTTASGNSAVGTVASNPAAASTAMASNPSASSADNPYGLSPAALPSSSADAMGGISKIDSNQPKQSPWNASDGPVRR